MVDNFWKADKRALSHSFAPRTLAVDFFPLFTDIMGQSIQVRIVAAMVDDLTNFFQVIQNKTNKEVDVGDFCQRFAFDVIGIMVYGRR